MSRQSLVLDIYQKLFGLILVERQLFWKMLTRHYGA